MKKKTQTIKTAPSITGVLQCSRKHQWNVVDLNPERKIVKCPVCSDYVSIREGLIK